MNFWRSSSLPKRLMPHRMLWSPCVDSLSGGPNIMIDGHHQRSSASCAIAFCAGVPVANVSMIWNPCRWWKLSSLQIRIIARAYGPYEQRHSGTWFMIAAPSTSQPMAPTSAHVSVG